MQCYVDEVSMGGGKESFFMSHRICNSS